jgi:uncharacterized coiled-coil protein SlyX
MSENVAELIAEIERLRARVAALEAELAVMRGSLAPHPADDEPARYTYNVQPNAPR